jgi:O-acetyl-ADP-ribose deacetylase (regulator of RNase III)
MLEFNRGNILDADVDALVNAVNCVGVMGIERGGGGAIGRMGTLATRLKINALVPLGT